MAKVIKYQFLSRDFDSGAEETSVMEPRLLEKVMPWSETNEEIARQEAYSGEYVIEDDGQPEPVETTDRVLNILLGV